MKNETELLNLRGKLLTSVFLWGLIMIVTPLNPAEFPPSRRSCCSPGFVCSVEDSSHVILLGSGSGSIQWLNLLLHSRFRIRQILTCVLQQQWLINEGNRSTDLQSSLCFWRTVILTLTWDSWFCDPAAAARRDFIAFCVHDKTVHSHTSSLNLLLLFRQLFKGAVGDFVHI